LVGENVLKVPLDSVENMCYYRLIQNIFSIARKERMMNHIFEGTVQVDVQGSKALICKDIQQSTVILEIVGFEAPKVLLIDQRDGIRQALEDYFENGDPANFLDLFNAPADISVDENEDQDLVVKLLPPSSNQIIYTMWVAVGIEDHIPAYDYLHWQITPKSDLPHAIWSIYC